MSDMLICLCLGCIDVLMSVELWQVDSKNIYSIFREMVNIQVHLTPVKEFDRIDFHEYIGHKVGVVLRLLSRNSEE